MRKSSKKPNSSKAQRSEAKGRGLGCAASAAPTFMRSYASDGLYSEIQGLSLTPVFFPCALGRYSMWAEQTVAAIRVSVDEGWQDVESVMREVLRVEHK